MYMDEYVAEIDMDDGPPPDNIDSIMSGIEERLKSNQREQSRLVGKIESLQKDLESLKAEESKLTATLQVLDETLASIRGGHRTDKVAMQRGDRSSVRGDLEKQVIAILQESVEPLDTRQIAEQLGRTDIPNVSSNLNRMVHKGLISQEKQGRRALWYIWHMPKLPATETEDDLPF